MFLPCRCERTSEAQKKADAEAELAEAEKRQVRAKAQAAAACAKAMLEIVGDIPKAMDLDGGLKQAGDNVAASSRSAKTRSPRPEADPRAQHRRCSHARGRGGFADPVGDGPSRVNPSAVQHARGASSLVIAILLVSVAIALAVRAATHSVMAAVAVFVHRRSSGRAQYVGIRAAQATLTRTRPALSWRPCLGLTRAALRRPERYGGAPASAKSVAPDLVEQRAAFFVWQGRASSAR